MNSEDKEKLQSAKGCMVSGVLIIILGIVIVGLSHEKNKFLEGVGVVVLILGAVTHLIGRASRWWYRDK